MEYCLLKTILLYRYTFKNRIVNNIEIKGCDSNLEVDMCQRVYLEVWVEIETVIENHVW